MSSRTTKNLAKIARENSRSEFKWEVASQDGLTHSVQLKYASRNEPCVVLVDGTQAASFPLNSGIIMGGEKQFLCGNEELIAVVRGKNAGIVKDGLFVGSDTPYKKDGNVPKGVIIALVVLNVLLPIVMLATSFMPIILALFPIIFALDGIIMTLSFCKSPFLSKGKAIICSLGITFAGWFFSVLLAIAMNMVK